MKNDLCELIVVIDESGSMSSVRGDTIGGFNTFLETHQKLAGEARLTLVKFNSNYYLVHDGVNVKDVPLLTEASYIPSDMTALLDAIGKTIDTVGKRLAATPEEERPEKVIFMIITDGAENVSTEYTKEQVKDKTTHQREKYGWEFIFMGADQDAWGNGRGMGVNNSVNFTQHDMGKTLKGMSYMSSNMRAKSANTSLENYNLSEKELDAKLAYVATHGVVDPTADPTVTTPIPTK